MKTKYIINIKAESKLTYPKLIERINDNRKFIENMLGMEIDEVNVETKTKKDVPWSEGTQENLI